MIEPLKRKKYLPMYLERNFPEIHFSEKKREKTNEHNSVYGMYHFCIKVKCYMCIYIEYLWRETQETNDCRLPVGMRTREPYCSGVKTYFFLDLLFNAYPYSF